MALASQGEIWNHNHKLEALRKVSLCLFDYTFLEQKTQSRVGKGFHNIELGGKGNEKPWCGLDARLSVLKIY